MSLVLDASVSVAWCYADETTPAVEAVFETVAQDHAVVPPIWRIEVANAFVMAVRRKRISVEARARAMQALGEFTITVDSQSDQLAWFASVGLADRHSLTAYDASYLELAIRLKVPLACLDGNLRRAATAESVTVIGQ